MRANEAIARLSGYNPNIPVGIHLTHGRNKLTLALDNITGHRQNDEAILTCDTANKAAMLGWEVLQRLETFKAGAVLKVRFSSGDELRFYEVEDIRIDCTGVHFTTKEENWDCTKN